MKLKTLAEMYDYTCFYCKKKYPLEKLTRDHYYPKKLGGKLIGNNQKLCCIDCNRRKADIPGHIFKEIKRQTYFNVK